MYTKYLGYKAPTKKSVLYQLHNFTSKVGDFTNSKRVIGLDWIKKKKVRNRQLIKRERTYYASVKFLITSLSMHVCRCVANLILSMPDFMHFSTTSVFHVVETSVQTSTTKPMPLFTIFQV